MSTPAAEAAAAYEIRYVPMTTDQKPLAFPCDDSGHVDLNALSARKLSDYLFARALVGRVFALPRIQAVH